MATRAMGAKGLEPCPICGASGRAHVAEVTNTYVTSSGTRYAAVCGNKSCRLSAIPSWKQCMATEADARSQWNGWSR